MGGSRERVVGGGVAGPWKSLPLSGPLFLGFSNEVHLQVPSAEPGTPPTPPQVGSCYPSPGLPLAGHSSPAKWHFPRAPLLSPCTQAWGPSTMWFSQLGTFPSQPPTVLHWPSLLHAHLSFNMPSPGSLSCQERRGPLLCVLRASGQRISLWLTGTFTLKGKCLVSVVPLASTQMPGT